MNDLHNMSLALHNLGNVLLHQGDLAEAKRHYELGLVIQRDLTDTRSMASSLDHLGNIAQAEGDRDLARALLGESLTLRRDMGDKLGIAYSLESLAGLRSEESDPALAARLWGAAAELRRKIDAPFPPNIRAAYDRAVAAARASVGGDAFAAAWAEGSGLTMEEAAALALANTGC